MRSVEIAALRRVISAQRAIGSAPPDVAIVCDIAANAACDLLGASWSVAAVLEDGRVVARGLSGPTPFPVGSELPLEGTIAGLAIRTRETQICTDSLTDPRAATSRASTVGIRSSVFVPLLDDGVSIGVIAALHPDPDAFDDHDAALLAMIAELTSHKLAYADAHRQLRRSTRKLEAALDLVGLSTWEMDVASGRLSWSPQMYRAFGVDPATFVPEVATIGALWHPEDFPRVVQATEECLATGEPQRLLVRALRPDGSERSFWSWVDVFHDDSGQARTVWGTLLDVTERETATMELERLAHSDQLTGLPNRTLLATRATAALRRSRGEGVALLLLDLDRFKIVNDSLGHQAGDALLVSVAERLTSMVREGATVARLGGDEFVVLVEDLRPATEVPEVVAIAQRLLDALSAPQSLPGVESYVATVSIGVSLAHEGTRDLEDLLREADLALYRAKDSGRNGWALFDDELRARADDRLSIEHDLRRVLGGTGSDSLELHYQPLVDLATNVVTGAEALVRLRRGDGSLLMPGSFIEVAEDIGLVVQLDSWVLENAVRQLGAWSRTPGLAQLTLSVNVTGQTLEQAVFVPRLSGLLRRAGLSGSRLRIEITERTLLDPTPRVQQTLRQLCELGVQVGLDDFGTGYSSLAYLQSFPLDFLKVDRSFVQGLGVDLRATALVDSIVHLAHGLGMVVVAEGVETADQLERVRALGCESAQGYLLARPGPVERLEELLAPPTLAAALAAG